MIKVKLLPSQNIKVRLKPAQGIRVGLNTAYIYDNSLIEDEVNLAKDWAIKTDGKVVEDGEEIDYSSKAYAIGGEGTTTNNAKYYAEQASTSATNASTSELNASASATAASGSADLASDKSTLAAQSEEAAKGYSISAGEYSESAQQAASDAHSSEVNATNAASTASSKADIAVEKATEAANSASAAYSSEQNAASSETNAGNSATAAATSETNAHYWAEGTDEQVIVLGGEHSSKVWAETSRDFTFGGAYYDSPHERIIVSESVNDMAEVARTGSYNDLLDKPTIGSGVLTIQENGVAVDTFSANATSNKTINITVPAEITPQNKLSSDLVDDTNKTNKFVTASEKTTWNGKQDAISDLDTIRSGASAGATAVQPDALSAYVKSVNENTPDSDGKVTLPNFTGTDGVDDGTSGLVPAPESYQYEYVLKSNGSWGTIDYSEIQNPPSIPTSSDYWTVGTQGGNSSQTTYSKKLIYYKQNGAQDNGFRMIADSDQSTAGSIGAWTGRVLIGNEKRTFLMGTARDTDSPTKSICGIGAHSWTSAIGQTGAAWDNVYFQPDGSTGCYLGGNGWRGNSGWFRVLNTNSGNTAYRVTINTGTAGSPSWKTILPNQATGSYSVQIKNDVSATFSYSYATSVGGTITANNGSSFGYGSSAAGYALALGYSAIAGGNYAIQIGYGTNNTANTLSVGLSSSLNVQLLNSSGKIPAGRLNIASSVDSSSTNDQMVGAKLFYDTVGDIETLLNNINSGS